MMKEYKKGDKIAFAFKHGDAGHPLHWELEYVGASEGSRGYYAEIQRRMDLVISNLSDFNHDKSSDEITMLRQKYTQRNQGEFRMVVGAVNIVRKQSDCMVDYITCSRGVLDIINERGDALGLIWGCVKSTDCTTYVDSRLGMFQKYNDDNICRMQTLVVERNKNSGALEVNVKQIVVGKHVGKRLELDEDFLKSLGEYADPKRINAENRIYHMKSYKMHDGVMKHIDFLRWLVVYMGQPQDAERQEYIKLLQSYIGSVNMHVYKATTNLRPLALYVYERTETKSCMFAKQHGGKGEWNSDWVIQEEDRFHPFDAYETGCNTLLLVSALNNCTRQSAT